MEVIERLATALLILKLADRVDLTEAERRKAKRFALQSIQCLPDPDDLAQVDSREVAQCQKRS